MPGSIAIRQQLFNMLRDEFGEPTSNRVSDWWSVDPRRINPVHICLNQATQQDEVHLLIYDSRQTEGQPVIEARAATTPEIEELFERIQRIVEANRTTR